MEKRTPAEDLEVARAAIRDMLTKARRVEEYGIHEPTLWKVWTRWFHNPVVQESWWVGPRALDELFTIGGEALKATGPFPERDATDTFSAETYRAIIESPDSN